MGLRRRPERDRSNKADPQFEVRADILMEAFHYAWMCALQEQMITSDNVAAAPRQLLRAVFMTAEKKVTNVESLGETAFQAWRGALKQMEVLREISPPSNALN